jgi:uncharacterized protein (DUF169 family)
MEQIEHLANLGAEVEDMLRLQTKIIAYRRLEKAEELDAIKNVARIDHFFTFCQVPFLVRVNGFTVGLTKEDPVSERCTRLCGLRPATEESKEAESKQLATTWFGTPEQAMEQQEDYPRIPPGGAIVLAPLTKKKFEPETLLIYGNPAQLMMLMCGLQKEKYEQFWFSFIGEGACSDSLGQSYVTGKPALSIPCYGERAMGSVTNDEICLAIPAGELERALNGLKRLHKTGLRYPISYIGPSLDPRPILARSYPDQHKG